MTTIESSTFHDTEENTVRKEVYTDGLKSTGRKVGFAVVFADITRRGALPGEASTHTAEMTAIKIAMREIQKKEMRWVVHADSLSSMVAIKNNKENNPFKSVI